MQADALHLVYVALESVSRPVAQSEAQTRRMRLIAIETPALDLEKRFVVAAVAELATLRRECLLFVAPCCHP